MSLQVEIIGDSIVFFPSNTIELYGITAMLDCLANSSSDPRAIKDGFKIDTELIMERDT